MTAPSAESAMREQMGRTCCPHVAALAHWELCTRAAWRNGCLPPTLATVSCVTLSLQWKSGPDLSQRYIAWGRLDIQKNEGQFEDRCSSYPGQLGKLIMSLQCWEGSADMWEPKWPEAAGLQAPSCHTPPPFLWDCCFALFLKQTLKCPRLSSK